MNTQQEIHEYMLINKRRQLDRAIRGQAAANKLVEDLTSECLEIRREMYRMGGEVK